MIRRKNRAGPCLYRPDNLHVSSNDRLCTFLHGYELRNGMNLESVVMLFLSVLMMIYLAYALLRPEKF